MKTLYLFVLVLFSVSLRSQAWIEENINTTRNLNDVFFLNSENGVLVGDSGTLFKFYDQSWHEINTEVAENFIAVHMVDTNNIWIAGRNGLIINYKDDSLINYASPTSYNFSDIFMLDDTNGWIIGEEGTILQFVNDEWIINNDVNVSTDLKQIDFFNDTIGLIAGSLHTILEYNDGWQDASFPYGKTVLYTSVCIADTNHYFFGNFQGLPGGIVTNGIVSWEFPGSNGTYVYSNHENGNGIIAIKVRNDKGWAICGWGDVLRYNGSTFELFQEINSGLKSLAFINDSSGWIVGNQGYLLKLLDDTSVTNHEYYEAFKMYPNPCREKITIQTIDCCCDKIEIYDICGRTARVFDCSNGFENRVNLDLSYLVNGVYFIKIEADNSTFVNKIIKH